MPAENYDAVVIGAGSVGLPTALFLAEAGLKVAVVDVLPSAGQGENKAAIGGVRATHSDPAKILLGEESLRIFSGWQESRGDNIGWKKGGYLFPVYRGGDETTLRGLLPLQKSYGLKIDWIGHGEVAELVPGIAPGGLVGGVFSPEDGQVSPLLACVAFYRAALQAGCTFFFNERVTDIHCASGRVTGLATGARRFSAPVVINAAGASAEQVAALAGVDIPVVPELHQAGITSPLKDFLSPLVVDMRPGPEGMTANFYFGQNAEGAVIFCYTPVDPDTGPGRDGTSEFLPVVARRLVSLLLRLKNAQVRRTWAGHYPMTPDGLPIIGKAPGVEGFYIAAGMCGQGFMLGPGAGRALGRLVTTGNPGFEKEAFETLSPGRSFSSGRGELLT